MPCNIKAYSQKPDDELKFIIKDATEAAEAMRSIGNYQAECKYLDQVNDCATTLYNRRQMDLLAA